MALEYFPCYHSYRRKIAKLSDQEVGRLFRSLLEYAETGETQELTGREAVAFDFIADDIDRAKEAYDEKCDKNRMNRAKAALTNDNDRQRPSTNDNDRQRPSTKPNTKPKTKTKENNPPLSPLQGETGFGDELYSAFLAWLDYKREKRQEYKPTGLQSLVSEIRNNAQKYGEQAVADLIRECMASNWQGIIFDKLEKQPRYSSQKKDVPKGCGELGDAELEAIRRVLADD